MKILCFSMIFKDFAAPVLLKAAPVLLKAAPVLPKAAPGTGGGEGLAAEFPVELAKAEAAAKQNRPLHWKGREGGRPGQ